MNITKSLKEIRNSKHLLQREVADKMGISESTYSHFESGDEVIPISRLISFSNIFNISIDYLFGLSKTMEYSYFKDNIDKVLAGKRLKEFRKENKLTLDKLSKILNCSKSTIAGYESGRYLIATPFLYDICKKYKISADYLLGKVDEPKYLK